MVSSVRQEQIDQLQPQRASDMFFGLPSVWFRERADTPETSINIRGLQDFGRVAVVVDGARQNFQRSGHNANGQFFLDPELVAEVDVARGPVTNIYGSGAIGGVVSFRTKDAQDVLRPGERIGALLNAESRLEPAARRSARSSAPRARTRTSTCSSAAPIARRSALPATAMATSCRTAATTTATGTRQGRRSARPTATRSSSARSRQDFRYKHRPERAATRSRSTSPTW